MSKKILITGGVGFIGTNMAIEAMKRGYKVVAFDNLSRNGVKDNLSYLQNTYKDKFKFVWGDVRKAGDFEKLPKKVDVIINLAANPSVVNSIKYPGYDFETNTGGTVNSLNYAKKVGAIFIQASTNKVYSDITNKIVTCEHPNNKRFYWGEWNHPELIYHKGVDLPKGDSHHVQAINENFPLSGFGKYGHSIYGVSKLASELYCQEYHIQFKIPMVIFRMSCIFGLFQKGVEEQAWVDHFLKKIIKGETINIFGTGKQVRDVLDGRDVARAYLDSLEAISSVNGEIFTIGGGPKNSYSLLEAIELIEKLTGKKAKLSFHKPRPSDQLIYISSIEKIEKKLEWKPEIGFEQALKDMIKQYD